MHILESHVRRIQVQLRSRTIRQAKVVGATGVVPRPSRDVVVVLPLAVAARSGFERELRANDAWRDVPLARSARWCGALQERSRQLLVFRNADVHHDAAADLLPELQAWRIAAGGTRRAARSA